MSLLRRHGWFGAAAGITLAFTVASLTAQRGPALTAFSDLTEWALLLAVTAVAVLNAWSGPRQQRTFWVLMSLGFLSWTVNGAAWIVWEMVLHRPIPDPFVFDIVLFFHAVPMFAAVAWRPDFASKRGKALLSVLNFLMLFGWWVFLYAFIVFPHQYVTHDFEKYNHYYDGLYAVENALLVAVLALAVFTSSGGWRRLYSHLLFPSVLYAINSQLLDRAAADKTYYS